jgi:phosphopantothenoylcysteine decarboxylase/phosphopantothenate--cysteine ligase
VAAEKIKKKESALDIELEPTKDILASLGVIKKEQFLVGFALETTNELINALAKLKQKNLDAIVLNSLNDKGAGFSGNTNKVTFIDKEERNTPFEMKPKSDVAIDIMNEILKKIDA